LSKRNYQCTLKIFTKQSYLMNLSINLSVALLIPVLFLSVAGKAQDNGRKITLDEAIDLSIKNSKPLRAAHARIDQATANTVISKQNQLPDLKVSASYLRLTQPNIVMAKNNNNNGNSSEPPKIDQAAYGIVNLSLPVYSGMRI